MELFGLRVSAGLLQLLNMETNSLAFKAALDLMQNVDHFYNNAWLHLVLYVTIFFSIFGVIMPLVTFLFQKRLFQIEEKAIANLVESRIGAIKADISSEVKTLIETEFKALNKKTDELFKRQRLEFESRAQKLSENFDREIYVATSRIFHVQMVTAASAQSFDCALDSSISAMLNQIKGDDEANLRRVLALLTEKCLPHVNKAFLTGVERYDERLDGVEAADEHMKGLAVKFDVLVAVATIRDHPYNRPGRQPWGQLSRGCHRLDGD